MKKLDNKIVDLKEKATFLAKVLKYNPELLQDEERFDDLVVAIESRLLESYFAGLQKKPIAEVTDFGSADIPEEFKGLLEKMTTKKCQMLS